MTTLPRCTECEEIELARVRDQLPSQTLPIPTELLAGFPQGRDRGSLTRRRLMAAGLAGVASVYGSRMLGWDEVFESIASADASDQNCLVVIFLAGGNDGLNTLVPQDPGQYAAYAAARPGLKRVLGPNDGGRIGSTAVAGTDLGWANVGVKGKHGFNDHGFDSIYDAGDLAILPAVDYQPPNFSHFASSDYWFNGALSGQTTGWLGRWIDNYGSSTNPLQAVSLDSALSKAIRTADKPVCAIQHLWMLGYDFDPGYSGHGTSSLGGTDAPAATTTAHFRSLGQVGGAGNPHLQRARDAWTQSADVYTTASALSLPNVPGYPSSSQNAGDLSYKLKLAALLLGANVGTRIITIHWGSFDTHGQQLQGQDPQLTELSRALGAFKADLANRGIEQNVSTLVFSEFGRRVAQNGTGTDHGAGGLMMLMGSQVQGGYAAPFPGCKPSELDPYGNLMVPTDFRSVYQAIIDEWLGGDPGAILPGGTFAPLDRQDAHSGLFV